LILSVSVPLLEPTFELVALAVDGGQTIVRQFPPLTSFQFPSTLFQSMAQSSGCENLATPESALGFLAVA
jgi:hypothetical protein